MKKVILCVAIAIVSVSCIKSDVQVETERLEQEKAIYELRLAKLEYVKTLIFIKKAEIGTPAERCIDSLINEGKDELYEYN